jgi:hypothetical protein
VGAYGKRTVCDIGETDYRFTVQNAGVQAVLPVPCDMAFSPGVYQGLDMVCGGGDGVVRDCGVKSYFPLERKRGMKTFWKGVITGAIGVLVLVLIVTVFRFFHERDRKIYEYMETQNELQDIREDISNRPPDEFLEDPGIRRAADNADTEFRRKRDEAVQRIRGGYAD